MPTFTKDKRVMWLAKLWSDRNQISVDKIQLRRKGLQKSDAVAVLGYGVTAAKSCCDLLSKISSQLSLKNAF